MGLQKLQVLLLEPDLAPPAVEQIAVLAVQQKAHLVNMVNRATDHHLMVHPLLLDPEQLRVLQQHRGQTRLYAPSPKAVF